MTSVPLAQSNYGSYSPGPAPRNNNNLGYARSLNGEQGRTNQGRTGIYYARGPSPLEMRNPAGERIPNAFGPRPIGPTSSFSSSQNGASSGSQQVQPSAVQQLRGRVLSPGYVPNANAAPLNMPRIYQGENRQLGWREPSINPVRNDPRVNGRTTQEIAREFPVLTNHVRSQGTVTRYLNSVEQARSTLRVNQNNRLVNQNGDRVSAANSIYVMSPQRNVVIPVAGFQQTGKGEVQANILPSQERVGQTMRTLHHSTPLGM